MGWKLAASSVAPTKVTVLLAELCCAFLWKFYLKKVDFIVDFFSTLQLNC